MRDWPGKHTIPIIIGSALLVAFVIIGENMQAWQDLAEVVQGFGVGFGTFLAAFWARPILSPIVKMLEQREEDRKRREQEKEAYRDKYIRRFGRLKKTGDALIWKLKGSDKILAIYKPNKTWQHIKTWGTYKKLGYESGGWDKEVEENRLNGYKEDEPIDFS